MAKECENCVYKSCFKSVECGSCIVSYYDGEQQGLPSNFKQKPMTNADRIRAMSDEELVKNFWEVMDDSKFCTGVCNEQRDCDICRLAWLKQPAEVDNG